MRASMIHLIMDYFKYWDMLERMNFQRTIKLHIHFLNYTKLKLRVSKII